ncbi:MAG: molybdopterin-dependent oxidoreductase [Thermoproteus sp. AZ2]|uniref:Molybdopterin-dependent oxidoreductase n=1 Tax=Thermoproteus sp. AZ2 TaxID=1609232 RepID=A0ACC6V2R2_9CREN
MAPIACTRDCYDTCVFEPVEAQRLIDLRPSPLYPTYGFTCPRGRADVKRLYSPNRLRKPLIRKEGGFVEVSWGRALEEIAEALKSADPAEVLHVEYDGNQGLLTWYYPARLFNAMGAASTDYSICSAEGHAALKLHWGRSWGALPEELLSARSVVFWGVNAAVSFIHAWIPLRRSGARIAAVDVAVTETLKQASLPVVVRPGTDVVLALGVARELIRSRSYDADFISKYAYGFEEFARYVDEFTPEKVAEETGVGAETFYELVEFYRGRPKTVIGFALGRTLNGGDAVRAISLIHALLGDPLGFFYSNSGAWGIDFDYLRGLHLAKPSRVVPMGLVGEEAPKLRAMYVWNSNPAATLPGGDKICEAALRGDLFLAVHDVTMTETAQCASVVLPAPTYLEKDDVVYGYWHELLIYNEAVAEPVGEAKPEHWVVRELGKLMGLGGHPLLAEDPWAAVERALSPAGVSLSELKSKRIVALRRGDPMSFKTKTGRLELYSETAKSLGLPPLPAYTRPPRGLVLTFTSEPLHTNTQFTAENGPIRPVVYVNPSHGLSGVICLEARGVRVKAVAEPDPSVPPGVLLMRGIPKSLDGAPINAVVDGAPNPYGGTPRLNYSVVEVAKC